MGNIISLDDNNMLNLNLKLNQFIQDWALNDYDDGINYKKTDNLTSNLLPKRAYCTNQKDMKIALPSYDNKTNSIVGNYNFETVKIQIDNDKIKNPNFKSSDYERGDVNNSAPSSCINIYGAEPTKIPPVLDEQNFCDHVKLERMKMYKNINMDMLSDKISNLKNQEYPQENELSKFRRDQDYPIKTDADLLKDLILYYEAYGLYYDDNQRNYEKNPYADCDCRNSVFYNQTVMGKSSNNSTIDKLPSTMLAQYFDIYCNTNNEAYKEIKKTFNGCLQITNNINNVVSGGLINSNNSCQVNENKQTTIVTEGAKPTEGPETPKEPETPEAPKAPQNNIMTKVYIILGVSVVIAILLLLKKFILI